MTPGNDDAVLMMCEEDRKKERKMQGETIQAFRRLLGWCSATFGRLVGYYYSLGFDPIREIQYYAGIKAHDSTDHF